MGTRFQPYPTYQASDISWYKAAPVHWQAVRFKYALSQKQKTPNNQLGAGSISFGRVIFKDSESIPSETLASYQEVLAGEFLINPLNMNYDLISLRTALSTINVVVSTGYIVLQCAGLLDKEFTKWLLHEFDVAHMKTLGSGVRQTITYADIGNSYFLKPPLSEQAQIATFLDRETAKIDSLIEKQQRLIELLEEKCQAVISHAVTKGLNPDAQLKDSGVEWLGEVPAHWTMKRLKHISPKIGVGLVINPSTYTKDEGLHFIFGGNVEPYGFKLENSRKISEQDSIKLNQSRLETNDIVSVRVGAPGVTAVVDQSLNGSNCASVMIVRRGDFNSDWLCACMNSPAGMAQVKRVEYGAAQKQFNISDAIEFVFPTPPKHEQDEISKFVGVMLNKFNKLMWTASRQIQLLNERRSALISAAVTGKIDVRDQVPQDV